MVIRVLSNLITTKVIPILLVVIIYLIKIHLLISYK